MGGDLARGRALCRKRTWVSAYGSLARADEQRPLGREDLELFATAAHMAGRDEELRRILERCHRAHLAAGDEPRAARAGFWLALGALLRGEIGPATGWLRSARRMIEGVDCVEHGYLLLPEIEQALERSDDERALGAAGVACGLGLRFGDADLTACARHLQGRALVRMGQIDEGLALLDEAMLAVVAGDLSPRMTGLIYCSVLDSCQQVFALDRARAWTVAFSRWCERQPEMEAFSGACLVHRARLLEWSGEWPAALAAARAA
jgi:hypothetical protein